VLCRTSPQRPLVCWEFDKRRGGERGGGGGGVNGRDEIWVGLGGFIKSKAVNEWTLRRRKRHTPGTLGSRVFIATHFSCHIAPRRHICGSEETRCLESESRKPESLFMAKLVNGPLAGHLAPKPKQGQQSATCDTESSTRHRRPQTHRFITHMHTRQTSTAHLAIKAAESAARDQRPTRRAH
jgi:hypothetical protein